MVVAFVGFVGGYAQGLLGPELLFVAGALAAVIVTWFTFLPSFLFILVGGPLVEATKEDLKFTAPLTAITAAVVGVILNLAVFFGYHVLWPTGLAGHFDWGAALITAGAATAVQVQARGDRGDCRLRCRGSLAQARCMRKASLVPSLDSYGTRCQAAGGGASHFPHHFNFT